VTRSLPLLAAALLAGCGGDAPSDQPVSRFQGPNPELVAPRESGLLPVMNVAEAKGWPAGKAPRAAAGLKANAFARGLRHPRSLLVLPNGDVLVAESDSPGTDKTGGPIKGRIEKRVMNKAGSGLGSANRITLLRDADGDGVVEARSTLLDHHLYSPFGMALVGGELFVANADALVAFPFKAGQAKIDVAPRVVAKLPTKYNRHWTKSLLPSPDGKKLYVGIGSNSNIGENGLDMEQERAAIWEIDPATGAHRIFASGLRNPVGIDWNPWSGELWTVVNERDELGNDLVPDYLTSVKPGAFYGWPWSYWGQNVDERVKPANPGQVARAVRPDYALGPHVAPLGLTFSDGQALGEQWAQGAFVGLHGSWNRKPWSGYAVVFVPFAGGRPSGLPIEVLSGFRIGDIAYGRPVDVRIARDGALLVTDDAGNMVWRVAKAG
jgi:glucose/arabinose dehydrogenase